MGRLHPTKKEIELLSDMFTEAADLLGVKVKAKIVNSTQLNIYHDADYDYKKEVELDIFLDEFPQIKVLRSLHWYNENDEILPVLAYIGTRDLEKSLINVVMGTRVTIPYDINTSVGVRNYKVLDSRLSPVPVFWVCKLTPVRETFKESIEDDIKHEQDDNFTHLKIPKKE